MCLTFMRWLESRMLDVWWHEQTSFYCALQILCGSTNRRFMPPCPEQVYRLRCSNSIWSLPICVPRFGSFPNMSKSFIRILFALVTSLMSPFQMFWGTMNSTHEKQRPSRIYAVCALTAPSAGQTASLPLPRPPCSLILKSEQWAALPGLLSI